MPKFDPQKPFDIAQGRHHRHSIRVQGYDYAQNGAYFVTIVTRHRDFLFGKIVNAEMVLNEYGKIADECWRAIPEHFLNVESGAYVIMPNHVHGIVVIRANESLLTMKTVDDRRGAAMLRPYDEQNPHKINVKPGSLGAIVRSYKSAVSYRINKEHNATGIWQRNYYEHIIRNEKDLRNKTEYILANPLLWEQADENPVNI